MARNTNGDISCTGCSGTIEGNGVIYVACITATDRYNPLVLDLRFGPAQGQDRRSEYSSSRVALCFSTSLKMVLECEYKSTWTNCI